jgi:flagellin-like protein
MNFEKVQRKNRKAISPVLATVILIAITLIAAIAIAGFVFGLFGTFTSSANLSFQVVGCNHAGGAGGVGDCQFALTNTGGSSASVTGCSIYGVTGVLSTTAGGAAATIPVAAGVTSANAVTAYCQASAAGTAGAVVSGSLTVASGSPLAFTGIYS